jgi:dipeptidyl aminopeptidase/acylaminoacyl peptidase
MSLRSAPDQLDLEKLLRVPLVDADHGFDVSPDGSTIAFSWNSSGQWEIYFQGINSAWEPKIITAGPGAKFAPKFSPDGKYLVYGLDLDGGEIFDVFLYDLAAGKSVNLTPETEYSFLPGFSWSPDSRQIATLSDRDGIFDTYVITLENGAINKVFQSGTPNDKVAWSPDGKYLAVCTFSQGQEFAIWIAKLDGSPSFPLEIEQIRLNAHSPSWSLDGRHLAFSALYGNYRRIGIYEVGSAEIHWLDETQADCEWPEWSPDGKVLSFIVSEGPDTWLAVKQLPGTGMELFQIDNGVHYAPIFTADGKYLLLPFDNYAHPTDIWLFSLKARTWRQLTFSLPEDSNPQDFIRPEHSWYPGIDGIAVPALIFKPKNMQPRSPAVIVIHGGPTWSFQYLWYPLFQHMARRGWVVLAPNYRGSTGYGQAWQLANRFDLGGVDARDIVAGAEYIVQSGLADPARLALTGRSHGGYLTMVCLTRYPELFAAGSAIVPFLNWFSSHENIRQDLQHWDIENMGDPQANYQRWYEASPYFFLDRLQAPVQLICGGNDPRCPASDSQEARDKLIALGKHVDYVLYADEGHAFLKIENVIDQEQRRIAFLSAVLDQSSPEERRSSQ